MKDKIMTGTKQNRFYDYASKDEAMADKAKKILGHEGATKEIHIDPIGIVTLPGGVATGDKRINKVETYSKARIDNDLITLGAKPLTDAQYKQIDDANKNASRIIKLNKLRQAGTITETARQQGIKSALNEARAVLAAGAPKGQPPLGVVASEEGVRKLVESKLKVAQQEVDKALKEAGVEASDLAKIRTPLESMVYNGGPKMLGPKIREALKKGDMAAVEREVRNNSNGGNTAEETKKGINNRRGKEANEFRSGIKEEFRHPPVEPSMTYSDPTVAKAYDEEKKRFVQQAKPAPQTEVPGLAKTQTHQPEVPAQKPRENLIVPELQKPGAKPLEGAIKPMFAPMKRDPQAEIFPMDRVKLNAIKLGGKLLEGMTRGAAQSTAETPQPKPAPQRYTTGLGVQLGQKIGGLITEQQNVAPIVFNPQTKIKRHDLSLADVQDNNAAAPDVPQTSLLRRILNYFKKSRD